MVYEPWGRADPKLLRYIVTDCPPPSPLDVGGTDHPHIYPTPTPWRWEATPGATGLSEARPVSIDHVNTNESQVYQ